MKNIDAKKIFYLLILTEIKHNTEDYCKLITEFLLNSESLVLHSDLNNRSYNLLVH